MSCPHLVINPKNQLVVLNCFEERQILKNLGAKWDGASRAWVLAFTMTNLEQVLDAIPHMTIAPDVEAKAIEQEKREREIVDIKRLAKVDADTELVVPGLIATLRPFQKLGVKFSLAAGSGALIADSPGLGKTIQAIATALMLKHMGLIKDCLVIAPASLKYNWPIEIAKFTREKYVVIDGTPEQRVGQWMSKDAFFFIANYELLQEDFHGGRKQKEGEEESAEQLAKRIVRAEKLQQRMQILSGVKRREWGLVVVDECFPYNTPVVTDRGIISIGRIVEDCMDVSVLSMDFSINEPSYKKVVRWIGKTLTGNLMEITHEHGTLICTANHKIWTEEHGYVRADELSSKGYPTLRVYPEAWEVKGGDCLPMVRQAISQDKEREVNGEVLQPVLLQSLEYISPRISGEIERVSLASNHAGDSDSLQGMSAAIYGSDSTRAGEGILLQEVQCDLENKKRTRMGCQGSKDAASLFAGSQGDEISKVFGSHEDEEPRPCVQEEGDGWYGGMEENPSVVSCAWREASNHHSTTEALSGTGLGMEAGAGGCQQAEDGGSHQVSAELLSDRHCPPCLEDSRGGGWQHPQNEQVENHRQQEGQGFVSSRLVGVKILERADYGRYGINHAEDTRVYNLEVEDTHNYIANGVLVSNCHAIKNHSSARTKNVKAINSKFRLGLSGTPLDGRLEELHSVMEFVVPGLLGSKTKFLQRHAVTNYWGQITGYQHVDEVKEKIANFYIRRLKQDVLKELPPKVFQNIVVSLSPVERQLYRQIATRKHEITEDSQAMTAILRAKQMLCHPALVGLPATGCSKLSVFRDLIEEVVVENRQKAVIFTQFRQMIPFIQAVLDELKIKYMIIDGGTPKPERASMQEKFNTDPDIMVMLGTEAMSTGLNFQTAEYVIHYDNPWSPSIFTQRCDRIHRIGKTGSATIVELTCHDTIEERIRNVLENKEAISSDVLGDDESSTLSLPKGLNPKDILKLL